MTNEAIEKGIVGPPPQDKVPVVTQPLQSIGVEAVNNERDVYTSTQESLKGTGITHNSPDIPHTDMTGSNHEQFEVRPKFSQDASGFSRSHLNEKLAKVAEFKESKSTKSGGILSGFKSLFGKHRKEASGDAA